MFLKFSHENKINPTHLNVNKPWWSTQNLSGFPKKITFSTLIQELKKADGLQVVARKEVVLIIDLKKRAFPLGGAPRKKIHANCRIIKQKKTRARGCGPSRWRLCEISTKCMDCVSVQFAIRRD